MLLGSLSCHNKNLEWRNQDICNCMYSRKWLRSSLPPDSVISCLGVPAPPSEMCAVVYKWTRANLASHLFGGLQPWCWTKCQASGRCTWGSYHLEEDPKQRRGCFLCLHGHLSRGHAWNQLHSWRDQSSQQCNLKWNDRVYQPFWKCKDYSFLWSLGWAERLHLMWPPMAIFFENAPWRTSSAMLLYDWVFVIHYMSSCCTFEDAFILMSCMILYASL